MIENQDQETLSLLSPHSQHQNYVKEKRRDLSQLIRSFTISKRSLLIYNHNSPESVGMIQEQYVISKTQETPPYDYNLRFTTELSESSSTQLSNGIIKDYIHPNLLFPQNINQSSSNKRSKDSIAGRLANKSYFQQDFPTLEGDPDYENLLELKAMEIIPVVSGTSSKASVTQRASIGGGGVNFEKKFEKDHMEFKQKFKDFFAQRQKSVQKIRKINHNTSQHQMSQSKCNRHLLKAKSLNLLVNITPKGHHMNHHSVLPVDKYGDTEPTPLPFFKNGQGHENFVANLAKKLTTENNQAKSFKTLKLAKKPEKQDENKETVTVVTLNKKPSIAGSVFPMLNISSESVSKAMTKENSKEDLILQRKQSFEKVNRKLVLREKNKTEESTSHLSVHHILLQNNSSVYQRFNEILKDTSHAELKKYMKPYQQDDVSLIVKTVQDSPPQKVNRVRIRSTSGKKKPITSHQSIVKPRESHSFIHEVTGNSTHSGLKRKKTLGYEPPMSDLKLGTRSTSQELFNNQMKSKDSFLLKHELLIDTDSEGRKTDEEQGATGGSGTMASFESNAGFESFQTLPTKPDQKKPKLNRGGSPMRYINPNRERSYLGQILQSQDNHNYVVTEANTSHTMYRKARKFKPMKVLLDNSRTEKTVNTGWENSTIEDYVHHTESKKSITKLNISNISHKLLDNSLVQSRRHTRVLKTKPDSESYLIRPSLMGKAHRVIMDANKLNNSNISFQHQPASKPRKSTAGIGKGNESFASYGEHLKLINNSFVDIKPRSQSKKLRK